MQELRVTIYGVVQGVGFRGFVDAHARELGLTGYVRNQEDGTVYCVVQGDEKVLHEFAALVRQGPSHAEVSDAEIAWGEPAEHYSSFDIRR